MTIYIYIYIYIHVYNHTYTYTHIHVLIPVRGLPPTAKGFGMNPALELV